MFALTHHNARRSKKSFLLGLSAVFLLVACDDAGNFDLQNVFSANEDTPAANVEKETATEFIEKDVEAPDVFFAQEAGLWDGRPSLGGVWVAHPDVKDPERVMIRNNSNGQFVVGALFRRERANPGPRLQLSSDAAQAIGVLAGAPVELEVVALKKEKIAVAPPATEVSETAQDAIDEPATIEQTSLDPIAAAETAIETAPPTQIETEAVAAAAAASPAVTSTLPVTSLEKPFIQVGIFNVEDNAEEAANQMSRAGLSPVVREEGSSEKPSWRVVVGPAGSTSELQSSLDKVKSAGFADAYLVSN